jgi:hypothetical protein
MIIASKLKEWEASSLTIFLVCNIIKEKKWKKDYAMFRICYSTQRYRV